MREGFEGKSVMRTRCLECETSRTRPDKFTIINIPLNLDDEDDELSANDLFMKLIMTSETLRENNKYWCEECSRLNEARISVEYEKLPKVMVLQLKRFTLTGSKYLSKINDFAPTPFTLECFCKACLQQHNHHHHHNNKGGQGGRKKKHEYRLYALIMHLGATLASGHYIAYVRADSATLGSMEYSKCQRGEEYAAAAANGKKHNNNGSAKSLTSNSAGKISALSQRKSSSSAAVNGTEKAPKNKNKGIMKFLRRGNNSQSSSSLHESTKQQQQQQQSQQHSESSSMSQPPSLTSLHAAESEKQLPKCRSAGCCGIKGLQTVTDSGGGGGRDRGHHRDHSSTSYNSADSSSEAEETDVWLECDDESIQAIKRKQLEEILGGSRGGQQGSATPYLLFYERI